MYLVRIYSMHHHDLVVSCQNIISWQIFLKEEKCFNIVHKTQGFCYSEHLIHNIIYVLPSQNYL